VSLQSSHGMAALNEVVVIIYSEQKPPYGTSLLRPLPSVVLLGKRGGARPVVPSRTQGVAATKGKCVSPPSTQLRAYAYMAL
jgi:hypothetical protein